MANIQSEQDIQTQKYEEAQKVIANLKLQLSDKASELNNENTKSAHNIKALEDQLASAQNERGVKTREYEEAQKVIANLKLQLSDKTSELNDEHTKNAQHRGFRRSIS